MAKRLIPNHAKPAHANAVVFQATAEFLGELCLRGLQATNDAFDLAVKHSRQKTSAIIDDTNKSYEERDKLLHNENKRETYFRDFGRAQHFAASTVLAYATVSGHSN